MKFQWILIYRTVYFSLECKPFKRYQEMQDFIYKKKLYYDYDLRNMRGYYYFRRRIPE